MDAAPELDPHTQELRMLMRTQWGDAAFEAADIDRILRLFGLVDGPYHRQAFGEMAAVERLAIIANHQMEACEWTNAYRTVIAIDRIEQRQAKEDAAEAGPITGRSRRPSPEPPMPEPTAADLTARERYRQLADARRDMTRERAGKPPFPRPQSGPVPPAPPAADPPAASLPFT